jgi:hypothetical protein
MHLLSGVSRGFTILGFVETVILVPVASEDGHLVAKVLEAYSSIDDKSLCAANAKVGMEKDDVLERGGR